MRHLQFSRADVFLDLPYEVLLTIAVRVVDRLVFDVGAEIGRRPATDARNTLEGSKPLFVDRLISRGLCPSRISENADAEDAAIEGGEAEAKAEPIKCTRFAIPFGEIFQYFGEKKTK